MLHVCISTESTFLELPSTNMGVIQVQHSMTVIQVHSMAWHGRRPRQVHGARLRPDII